MIESDGGRDDGGDGGGKRERGRRERGESGERGGMEGEWDGDASGAVLGFAPAVGEGFGFGAEPAFAVGGGDLGELVAAAVREVVDFLVVVADVAFDGAAGGFSGAAVRAGAGRVDGRAGRERGGRHRPEAAVSGAGVGLELAEVGQVFDVGRVGDDVGEAEADKLGVDHQVAEPDVAQEAAVLVGFGDVLFKADGLAEDELAVLGGGLFAEGLDGLVGVDGLRGVDADVADGDDAAADVDLDGVAVDDLGHTGGGRRGGRRRSDGRRLHVQG